MKLEKNTLLAGCGRSDLFRTGHDNQNHYSDSSKISCPSFSFVKMKIAKELANDSSQLQPISEYAQGHSDRGLYASFKGLKMLSRSNSKEKLTDLEPDHSIKNDPSVAPDEQSQVENRDPHLHDDVLSQSMVDVMLDKKKAAKREFKKVLDMSREDRAKKFSFTGTLEKTVHKIRRDKLGPTAIHASINEAIVQHPPDQRFCPRSFTSCAHEAHASPWS